jgi:uncharacterized protein YndB with AHSA1/START domain
MTSTETSVRKTVVVRAPIQHAFRVFTEQFNSWWPQTHHIGKVEPFVAILEPREGGRWYERAADGSECEWGKVLVYSPPHRVAFSWHLDASYAYDPDPARASRVDVSFHDDGDGKTRVELVHSELQRHGGDWQKLRDGVGSQGGWGGIMEMFATKAAA